MTDAIFVCFEGVEGCGKTTQAQILQKRLELANVQVNMIREPGTTPLGRHLRDYLKSGQPLSLKAELLLFEAARAELVQTTIKPCLISKISIIADRFEASSVAYQGFGRNLDQDMIESLNHYVTDGCHPDVTILLDLPTDREMERIGLQLPLQLELLNGHVPNRIDIESQRRFEDLPKRFHQKVRTGYLKIAKKSPDTWLVIDATKSIDEIANQVWSCVTKLLSLPMSVAQVSSVSSGAAIGQETG